jgi:hypothetical protein
LIVRKLWTNKRDRKSLWHWVCEFSRI